MQAIQSRRADDHAGSETAAVCLGWRRVVRYIGTEVECQRSLVILAPNSDPGDQDKALMKAVAGTWFDDCPTRQPFVVVCSDTIWFPEHGFLRRRSCCGSATVRLVRCGGAARRMTVPLTRGTALA